MASGTDLPAQQLFKPAGDNEEKSKLSSGGPSKYKLLISGLLLLLALTHCASPGTLSGGEKDETPPQIVSEKSTPNGQTNFRPSQIRLTFDEWVRLKDVGQQVIVSPPFRGYEIRLKGKSLIFDFGNKDTL
ncbi:MAG: hypothetical protein D6772_11210, partial [Bacteroidetes bacterium]